MHDNIAFLENGKLTTGSRTYIGDQKTFNEAWLRDTLFEHPDLIPTNQIDSAFGPLVPLCKEMRTEAGPVDAVFINEHGRITIVECKLWRNPQARREVVAQTLDYVSAMKGWSYADFQRQVSAATRRHGNVPFDVMRGHTGQKVREPEFIDSVSRCLREGRILVLIAGDGIREGIRSLTELVNRNSTNAYTFGLVEVAVYHFGKSKFAIHPRVLAKTELVTRQFAMMNPPAGSSSTTMEEIGDEPSAPVPTGNKRQHLRKFWEPLLSMTFDDPEQEGAKFNPATNNLSLLMPFRGIQVKAFATVDGRNTGVFLATRGNAYDAIKTFVWRERRALLQALPKGTVVAKEEDDSPSLISLQTSELSGDTQRRAWLKKTLNEFVNVLRPRMRQWYDEQ